MMSRQYTSCLLPTTILFFEIICNVEVLFLRIVSRSHSQTVINICLNEIFGIPTRTPTSSIVRKPNGLRFEQTNHNKHTLNKLVDKATNRLLDEACAWWPVRLTGRMLKRAKEGDCCE